MADPRRLAVQKKICEIIAAIREDNGFETSSLEGAVFRGRTVYGADDPLPMVSVLEPEEIPEYVVTSNPSTRRASEYDLIVQGWAEDDPENPTDPAHYLAADVTRALAIARKKTGTSALLDGLAGTLSFTPAVVRPANEFSDKASFLMRVTLTIVEDLENPFA